MKRKRQYKPKEVDLAELTDGQLYRAAAPRHSGRKRSRTVEARTQRAALQAELFSRGCVQVEVPDA